MKNKLTLILLLALLLAGCGGATNENKNTGSQVTGINNSTFTSPLEGVTTASIAINAPFEKAFISPLAESDNLIEAEVEHMGEMIFSEQDDTITLREDASGISYEGDKPLRWNVLVSPDPALALNLRTASGELTLDASNLKLSSLVLDSSSGTIDADLPATADAIKTEIDLASGAITVNMPDNAKVDFSRVKTSSGTVTLNIGADATVNLADIDIASGRVVVDVPTDTPVRLEIQEVASGTVNIAYRMVRLTGTASDEGIWETENYEDAENRITIIVTHISSGTFELE